MEQRKDKGYSPKDIDKCISILANLVDNSDDFAGLSKEQQIELMKTAGQLSRPDRYQLIKRNKAIRKKHRQQIVTLERKARAATGIRLAREDAVFTAPLQLPDNTESGKEHLVLQSPRNCYICKAEFTKLHFFYDSMCPHCAELNYQKR
ncbi:MAG: hypothetical protein KAR21_03530, partial [Spirochaetales bacterium]|nr:hypothetical protein [Spirochaetales bacterium]